MEETVIFVFCVLIATAVALPPPVSKQYRTDYEYSAKTDAFYKLHVQTRRAWQASKICQAEGAELMIPSIDDIGQLHSMVLNFPYHNTEFVVVGSDAQTHEIITLNTTPKRDSEDPEKFVCNVVTTEGEIKTIANCLIDLPFICKVAAKDAPYSKECDAYGKDYRYYPSVGSCYQIPRIALPWHQAYTECQAEGAHLVVLNSQAEHDAVYNLITTEPRVTGSKLSYFLLAGYRGKRVESIAGSEGAVLFLTIFDQTLKEAGFGVWAPNEPNNWEKLELCGSIFLNDGNLNDLFCDREYGFICEKEVKH